MFNLRRMLRRLLGKEFTPSQDAEGPVSFVLLLRESHVFTAERLRAAGEAAFHHEFSDDNQSRYFVVSSKRMTFLKAGLHTFNFIAVPWRYGNAELDREFVEVFPDVGDQRAWQQHNAWVAIDYLKGGKDVSSEYAALATVCAQLVDPNCTAIWVPRDQWFLRNDHSLPAKLSAIQKAARRS